MIFHQWLTLLCFRVFSCYENISETFAVLLALNSKLVNKYTYKLSFFSEPLLDYMIMVYMIFYNILSCFCC